MDDIKLDKHLIEIERKLNNESTNIINYVVTVDNSSFGSEIFEPVKLNKINKSNVDSLADGPAIYIFKMIHDVDIAISEFNQVNYGAKTSAKCKKIKKDDILYLGKSFKIKTRIKQHTIECGDKTYSLRLFDEKRRKLNNNYVIYIFKLKTDYVKHSQVILSSVETFLHEKLNPKVGSRRV